MKKPPTPFGDTSDIQQALSLLHADNQAIIASNKMLSDSNEKLLSAIQSLSFSPTLSAYQLSGVADGGTATTLTDLTKGWLPGELFAAVVYVTISGAVYATTVTANTIDTLTFTAIPASVKKGSVYQIVPPISSKDVLSSGNVLKFVTTTPLAANATYDSGWLQHVPTTGIGSVFAQYVVGAASSDQSGTLYCDYSFDGVNTAATENIPLTGGTPIIFDRKLRANYVKVRYVNGATAQATFTLGARLTAV